MPTVINVKPVKICSETIRIAVLHNFLVVLEIKQVFDLYDDFFDICHVTV